MLYEYFIIPQCIIKYYLFKKIGELENLIHLILRFTK
jgi:hypothetical protein